MKERTPRTEQSSEVDQRHVAAWDDIDSATRPGKVCAEMPEKDVPTVGVVTRAVSWLVDWAVIQVVAIVVGLGVSLLLAIFPLAEHLKPAFEGIAGGVFILWAATYFVLLWSMTGQTLGARVMQIRLVTAKRARVKPARAFVRWVGMNLSILFLCAGHVPILFGRRGFPDWLAKTLVLDSQQQASIAEALVASRRAARERSPTHPAATSSEPASTSPDLSDGHGEGVGRANRRRASLAEG